MRELHVNLINKASRGKRGTTVCAAQLHGVGCVRSTLGLRGTSRATFEKHWCQHYKAGWWLDFGTVEGSQPINAVHPLNCLQDFRQLRCMAYQHPPGRRRRASSFSA